MDALQSSIPHEQLLSANITAESAQIGAFGIVRQASSKGCGVSGKHVRHLATELMRYVIWSSAASCQAILRLSLPTACIKTEVRCGAGSHGRCVHQLSSSGSVDTSRMQAWPLGSSLA